MHPRLIQFGSIAIPTSGALTAVGIVLALFVARATARRLSLDAERVWDLGIAGVLTALVAPRILLILTNWSDFRAHPLWMLGVFSVRSQTALLGGFLIAIVVMFAYGFFAKLPFRRTLDAFAPALALGYAISRLGAFAAGADFGTPTNRPWAVVYTSRLSSLWSGTPLGTPLHPVQVYEALAELGILVLLTAMLLRQNEWKLRDGEIMGAGLFLSGFCGCLLASFRADNASGQMWIPQIAAAAMVFVGGLLWLL